jgi:16S rRNA (guanine966-N2)-methyltransferase
VGRFGIVVSKGEREGFLLRVTGGKLVGRRLSAPRGDAVRPSADRVRESVFASLGPLQGARVLDLYAGSGALGIEALSRGAAEAVFVERAPAALEVLRHNLKQLGLTDRSRVLRSDAQSAIRQLGRRGECYELILVDPPYASGEAERAMLGVVESGILSAGGALVVEISRRHPPGEVAGLEKLDERRYGDTVMLRFRNCIGSGGAE